MAGFFGLFDYSKPGKGVDTNAPPKRPIIRYFELYWRKFSRMVLLNLMMFIIVLPIVTLLFIQYDVFAQTIGMEAGEALDHLMLPKMMIDLAGRFHGAVSWILLAVSVVLYGPAMCGLTYMLRNAYREEHAWLSDFFGKMKENFAQGLILGILEIGAIFFCTFNLLIQPSEQLGGTLLSVLKTVSCVGIAFTLMMRNYSYLMAVTFRLRTFNIISNSFLFSFIGLFRNLGIILLEAGLLIPLLLVSVYDLVFLPLFYLTVTGFAAMFVSYPMVHKYLIEPTEAKDDSDDDSEDTPTDTVERVDPRLLGGDIDE